MGLVGVMVDLEAGGCYGGLWGHVGVMVDFGDM